MHDAILPSPLPESTQCQLYPSLGDQGSPGPPRNTTGVLEAAATRATERREETGERRERGGGELSLGGSRESLRSHKCQRRMVKTASDPQTTSLFA